MNVFDPNDWYYKLRSESERVFSSKRGVFVPITDEAFEAWKTLGNSPVPVDSAAEIGAALALFRVRSTEQSVLDGYTEAHAETVIFKLMFKVVFNHENRIRALEGKAPVTASQARTAMKALM